ncbi:hypothetical protein ABFS83_10G108300 [Erythranthe nasuta]
MEMNASHSAKTPPQNGISSRSCNGGLRTMPFIIANEALEKIASYGLIPNMILYLITVYHFSAADATTILFIWGAISNFMPILGAFLSDSYFGRFLVISIATLTTLLGLVLLWLTAVIEKSRSPKCDIRESGICDNTKPVQMILLFVAFVLMSIGVGGIRPCSMAFGADQFENPENPNNVRIMESFFNWYYASLGVSLMIALTVIVYIQNEFGWVIGFGVPVGLMLLSAVMFFIGSKLYVNVKPNKSLLTGLVQVWVAYWNKRHLPFPPDVDDSAHYYYNYYNDHSKFFVPTQKLRYLNKACMLINPEKEIKADGSPSDTWSLCSVMQVQVLKSLIQLLPIWSTGIMIGVTISQHSFPVLQANTLNRRLAGNFKIPAGSFGIFAILTLTIWVILYDRVIVPLLSKHTNNPRGIKVITRIGIGIFISCMATATAALVERARRAKAIHQGLEETPNAEVDMSALWLLPQHCLTGLGEGLNAIGQIELYYSQFPKSMASISVALFALGMAFANIVGSLIVNIVDVASKSADATKESWVSTNLNKGHYDYYYWILTLLSLANLIYFYFCSRAFKYCDHDIFWDCDNRAAQFTDKEDVMLDIPKSTGDDSSSIYFSA